MSSYAHPRQLLRAAQKDTIYSNLVHSLFRDLGVSADPLIAKCIYAALTLPQSLGQEAVDIFPSHKNISAGTARLFVGLFLHLLLPVVVRILVKKLKKMAWLRTNNRRQNFRQILKVCNLIQEMHSAHFFITGNFMNLSNRVAGIRYVNFT